MNDDEYPDLIIGNHRTLFENSDQFNHIFSNKTEKHQVHMNRMLQFTLNQDQ